MRRPAFPQKGVQSQKTLKEKDQDQEKGKKKEKKRETPGASHNQDREKRKTELSRNDQIGKEVSRKNPEKKIPD